MKKILLITLSIMFAFASATKVTLISKKTTKNSIIFNYDVPDKNFNLLKKDPKFYKNLAKAMICKNKDARLLSNSMDIVYNYKKHSNNKDNVIIIIKQGSCNSK